jgi:hypothetical protein
MLKISSIFLKASIHPFHSASYNFSKSFLVIATNSLFSVMFKVIWAICLVAVDCFFKKFSQKEVRWYKVCGWLWPQGTLDWRSPASKLWFLHYEWWPHHAETSNPVCFLPAKQLIESKDFESFLQ